MSEWPRDRTTSRPSASPTPEPPPQLRVDRLSPGDAGRVQAAATLFTHPPDAEAVRTYLASPTDHLFIAYLDDLPAGYARAHELRRLDGPRPKLMLYEIGTVPRFRRRGVARALIEAVKELGRERRASLMFAITALGNTAAVRLYARTGGRRLSFDDAIYSYDLSAEALPEDPQA